MMKIDLVASSIAISVFLLFYYASVSVLTIYWVVTFNRTTPQANGINVWLAASLSIGLVVAGALSDWARVRKPFMLVGAICAMVMMGFLIVQMGHPHTGYYSNVLVIVLLALSIAIAYTPWMANYTEQVESHNPALTATGLAVWGWILRITRRPLVPRAAPRHHHVDHAGGQPDGGRHVADDPGRAALCPHDDTACVQLDRGTRVGDQRACRATREAGPETLATVLATCNSTHNLGQALTAAGGLSNPQVQGLLAYSPLATAIQNGQPVSQAEIQSKVGVHSQNLASLLVAEQKLVPAQKASPDEWKRWWGVCLGGMLVFAVLVFFMRGRWSPRAARRDLDGARSHHLRRAGQAGRRPETEAAPVG